MKKFQDLTFADHYMFEKVLQNKDICKELLERLLKIQIARLEYPEIEKNNFSILRNPWRASGCLR
jgi:hypothetical protein